MVKTMSSAAHLWHIRKQMMLHYASFVFMTYIFFMGNRSPGRIYFSRSNGSLHTTDMLASFSNPNQRPEFGHTEPVPFRFTPNIQRFFTAIGAEGVISSALLAIARALVEKEGDLEHRASIFIREEVITWYHLAHKSPPEGALREYTLQNMDALVKRAQLLSCKLEREKQPVGSIPCNQTILELLSAATNPAKLALMDVQLLAWL